MNKFCICHYIKICIQFFVSFGAHHGPLKASEFMVRHQKLSSKTAEYAREIRKDYKRIISNLCKYQVCSGVHFIGDIGFSKITRKAVLLISASWID